MSRVYEEMANVEWLMSMGMDYELALDLAIRDRRLILRRRKELLSVLTAWVNAGLLP
jgi:hypothetical protein